MVSPRESASLAKAAVPATAIDDQRSAEPIRRMGLQEVKEMTGGEIVPRLTFVQ